MNQWMKISGQYRWRDRVDFQSIRMMPGYPHMFTAKADDCTYVVKKLLPNEYISPDQLFQGLICHPSILFPLLTENGRYCAKADGDCYLVYPMIGQINESPSPEWWGKCLQTFHRTQVNPVVLRQPKIDDYGRVERFFRSAEPYMDRDIVEKLCRLLHCAHEIPEKTVEDGVLCHGDPSLWNVLQNHQGYKLIDVENCFPAPREFDLQHLLWNQGAVCEDFAQWEDFLCRLQKTYETASGVKINFNLLTRLFCLDFVKVISWLYMVTGDPKREDQARQSAELVLFQRMIRADFPEKMVAAFCLQTDIESETDNRNG